MLQVMSKFSELKEIASRLEKKVNKNHKSYTKLFAEAKQEREAILKCVNGSGWSTSNLLSPALESNFRSQERIKADFTPYYYKFDKISLMLESGLDLWWFGNIIEHTPPLYETKSLDYQKKWRRT